MTDFLNDLNEAQREAVQYIDGPQLVIAGAGSGKTRVLTYKIAFLLEHGMAPWNILALTFTNKAAREMRERIERQVQDKSLAGLAMGTFHSVFARILRREAQTIGYSERFSIYDADDSKSLVKTIIAEMQLNDKLYVHKDVAEQISRAKERLLTPDAMRADALSMERCRAKGVAMVPEIYSRYQQRLRQSNAMDFDDLLLQTFLLFRDHDDVRRRYVERFQYVLVDEYQDTNFAQHAIVRQLAADHGRLCVVGDDAQSIYSFRGANIDNILQLNQSFPNLKVFKLERNYRSTQSIVNAANSVIARNQRQYKKDVYSEKEVGEPVNIIETYSDIEEALVVAKKVKTLSRRYSLSDMAILYRTNSQSRSFEEALRSARLPYRIYGGLSFYQRREIKDVIAYCRLAVNAYDEEALRRVINVPARGIGDKTTMKLFTEANATECRPWDVLNERLDTLGLAAAAKKRLTAFRDLIVSFADMASESDADAAMVRIIKESGLRDALWNSGDIDDKVRQENVQELINACSNFVAARKDDGSPAPLAQFLQEVSLLTDQDRDDGDEQTDRVTLMTIHASKGLEFPVVFVVGMEDELFPGEKAYESPKSMEEERRLFYVAVTRAGDLCFLTMSKMRRRYGQLNFQTPSRFLKEIDSKWRKHKNPIL